MSEKKEPGHFSEEFKSQLIQLNNSGKQKADISLECRIHPTAFNRWITRINQADPPKESGNRIPEENELIRLRKENQRLTMENEIIKHVALIFTQRYK